MIFLTWYIISIFPETFNLISTLFSFFFFSRFIFGFFCLYLYSNWQRGRQETEGKRGMTCSIGPWSDSNLGRCDYMTSALTTWPPRRSLSLPSDWISFSSCFYSLTKVFRSSCFSFYLDIVCFQQVKKKDVDENYNKNYLSMKLTLTCTFEFLHVYALMSTSLLQFCFSSFVFSCVPQLQN